MDTHYKAASLEQLYQAYLEGNLQYLQTQKLALVLKQNGYKLTKDDLNKMRQLFAKIEPFNNDTLQIVKCIANRLETYAAKHKFTEQEAHELSHINKVQYRVSKTAITKLNSLIHSGRVEI